MPKFRKLPVEIEARRLVGPPPEMHAVYQWVEEHTAGSFDPAVLDDPDTPNPTSGVSIDPATGGILIATLEGVMLAGPGDWIIRGVKGEFYPCKHDVFQATYEPVPETMAESPMQHPRLVHSLRWMDADGRYVRAVHTSSENADRVAAFLGAYQSSTRSDGKRVVHTPDVMLTYDVGDFIVYDGGHYSVATEANFTANHRRA